VGIILSVDGIEENVKIDDEKIIETLGNTVGVIFLRNGFLLYNMIPTENLIINNYTTMLLSQNIIQKEPDNVCFLGTSIFIFPDEINLYKINEVN